MGCRCCRMIQSYIYDPSVAVDVRKSDSAGSSLYHPHHLPGDAPGANPPGDHAKQKQGFHNLGYSKSSQSSLKLELDNNHVNHRLHAAPAPGRLPHQQAGAPAADGQLYIIRPNALTPQWVTRDRGPSQVPVYPDANERERRYEERAHRGTGKGWDDPAAGCVSGSGSLSADDIDEGVGGTPEYPCDTGDEGSVLSVDIHTSTTSLSSADTRDERGPAKAPDVSTVESGICVAKSEDEEEQEEDEAEVRSVTDSMVAEALAALEAATAGEDCE